MKQRTITLTGRPPVKINEETWPVIASAADEASGDDWTSKWFVGVRQHEDGRAIVYATYSFKTNWPNVKDIYIKRGVLLDEATTAKIVHAIESVCMDISTADHNKSTKYMGDDSSNWVALSHQCIASLPAEELA